MLKEYEAVLKEIQDNSDIQWEGIDQQITQCESQISELQEQIYALENGLMLDITIEMQELLENKFNELYSDSTAYYLYYISDQTSSGFGISNVSDFAIKKYSDDSIVYEYQGVGWDDSTAMIRCITSFNWAYDYIHKEYGLDGTYGLQARIDKLNDVIDLLEINKSKYQDTSSSLSGFVI